MRTVSHPVTGLFLLFLLLPAAGGCMGFATYVTYALRGNRVPAEFDGLVGKRVVVICVSGSFDGPRSPSTMLAREMERLLREHVKKINLIPQDAISAWKDTNDWRETDYLEVGRGVNAEMVVAIELHRLSLYEGPTLFKGKAEVELEVFNVATGESEFSRTTPEYSFPTNGYHDPNMREAHFQQIYLKMLARQLCKPFYAYEFEEDFANDPALLSR